MVVAGSWRGLSLDAGGVPVPFLFLSFAIVHSVFRVFFRVFTDLGVINAEFLIVSVWNNLCKQGVDGIRAGCIQ